MNHVSFLFNTGIHITDFLTTELLKSLWKYHITNSKEHSIDLQFLFLNSFLCFVLERGYAILKSEGTRTSNFIACKVMLRKCKVDVVVFQDTTVYNEIIIIKGGFHYEIIG